MQGSYGSQNNLLLFITENVKIKNPRLFAQEHIMRYSLPYHPAPYYNVPESYI